MPTIRKLGPQVTSKIAAGEVVERPASVLKELIENSLDAGATRIKVTIGGAGMEMIEVADNGCGMDRTDIKLAPQSFSTSKISKEEDISSLATYGFRGEALASIGSVARMTITSCPQGAEEGVSVQVEGGRMIGVKPAGREAGTTVTVRDLFFNTPARKKFMKSPATERRKLVETLIAYALIHHQVTFHLLEEEKHLYDFVSTASWRERVGSVLGENTMKHMVEVRGEQGYMKLSGFTSLPTYTRGSRDHQYLYINNRLAREKSFIYALTRAYQGVIPADRHPCSVLSLTLPPQQVDVNVHPSKQEVRFSRGAEVHDFVGRTVGVSLSARASAATVSLPSPESSYDGREESLLPRPARGREEQLAGIREAFADYMENRSPTLDLSPQLSLYPGEEVGRKLGDEGLFWQFNDTYIFIQVRGGLVIIDQHAAHERVIFDAGKKNLEGSIPVSQQILFPIHLELSLSELEVFRASHDVFTKLGFVLEPFGGKSILVRGYPQGLRNWNDGRLLLQIFDDLLADKAPGDSTSEKILASFACHSAIRAGQKIGAEEMRLLADQLFASANPFSCPHGRPTIQRIPLEQIEKWFHRK